MAVEMTDELRALWRERTVCDPFGGWWVGQYEAAMRRVTDRTDAEVPYWETADERFNAAPGEAIWDQSDVEITPSKARELAFELLVISDLVEASLPRGDG